MGTLTSVFGEIKNAVLAMRVNAYDENDKDYLNKVIDDTIREHPEDADNLRKFQEIAALTEKDLENKVKTLEAKGDYARIENKIEKGDVKVDIEAAQKSGKGIESRKGKEQEDRQRIR